MTKYERIAFWTVITFAAVIFLYSILPPVGWAVIALFAVSYGLGELAERAMHRVRRRRL